MTHFSRISKVTLDLHFLSGQQLLSGEAVDHWAEDGSPPGPTSEKRWDGGGKTPGSTPGPLLPCALTRSCGAGHCSPRRGPSAPTTATQFPSRASFTTASATGQTPYSKSPIVDFRSEDLTGAVQSGKEIKALGPGALLPRALRQKERWQVR